MFELFLPLVSACTIIYYLLWKITSTENNDYQATSVVLTFDASTSRAYADIPIQPDDIYEDDEIFSVSLTPNDKSVTVGPPSTVTITDNDGWLKRL